MYKLTGSFLIIGIALATLHCVPVANAQSDESDASADSRDCINLRSVRRTEVVDDLNVLFHMSGKKVYQNILPRQCSGLAREDRFSYTTSMGRLCRQDMIRVLYSDPFGIREGNSCQLGQFHEITLEDVKAMKEAREQPPRSNPLPMPVPQEVGVEPAEEIEEEQN